MFESYFFCLFLSGAACRWCTCTGHTPPSSPRPNADLNGSFRSAFGLFTFPIQSDSIRVKTLMKRFENDRRGAAARAKTTDVMISARTTMKNDIKRPYNRQYWVTRIHDEPVTLRRYIVKSREIATLPQKGIYVDRPLVNLCQNNFCTLLLKLDTFHRILFLFSWYCL